MIQPTSVVFAAIHPVVSICSLLHNDLTSSGWAGVSQMSESSLCQFQARAFNYYARPPELQSLCCEPSDFWNDEYQTRLEAENMAEL